MLHFLFDIAANVKNLNEAARLRLKHPLKKEKIKTASKLIIMLIIPNKSFQYKFTLIINLTAFIDTYI